VFAVVPAGLGSVSEGSLGAVAEEVSEAEFGEEALNQNMRDMGWLAPRATHHQEVCARLLEGADAVVPLSFGTVFRDEDGVRAMLRERADELEARLATVRGRAEWVVALSRDGARARAWVEQDGASAVAEVRRQIEASPPGRAYLLARRLDEAHRQGLFELDAGAVAALQDALAGIAERTFREPLAEGAGPAAAGGSGMIARVSVLAPRAGEARLRAALNQLAEAWRPRGYEVDATGPWPPYRFGGGG
jgi:hypothetical protein